jgi:hypothetical protein
VVVARERARKLLLQRRGSLRSLLEKRLVMADAKSSFLFSIVSKMDGGRCATLRPTRRRLRSSEGSECMHDAPRAGAR